MYLRVIATGFIFILLKVSLASAQEWSPPGPPPGPPDAHHQITPLPGANLPQLKEMLDLSEDQIAKIENIMDAMQDKIDSLQDKIDKMQHENMDSMKKIKDEGDNQIEKVLTDSQKKKFERMKKECCRHRPPPPHDDFGEGPPCE
jgi:Spy/CpxP family protein refolding chaperone